MKVINPANLEVIANLDEDTDNSLTEKFHLLKDGQTQWKNRSLKERISIIAKFHDLLEENKNELAQILTSEMGKPLNEATNEINGAKFRTKFFIDHTEKWLKKEEQFDDGRTKDILDFEPLGVICNISAWNYPYLVGVNVIIPALLAGNAVMYKPSEFSSLTGNKIRELLIKAGVPKNVFEVGIGGKSVGEKLLNLNFDGYYFTGSYKTGKFIATQVAHKLVPVGLELGGKDPLYVTEDVDVEKAANMAAEGAFYNNGQSCCAVERIYINEKIYDKFKDAFINECKKLKVGDPLNKETTQGPLTRSEQIAVLEDQVKDAVSKGAKLALGGDRPKLKGSYFNPTVLTEVNHKMKVMMDESFGPIIGLQKVKDDSEATKLMNDNEYGLTAAVFCKDKSRAEKIVKEINAGNVYINCCDRVSPYLPWAGRKNSGMGATLSYLGILTFAKPKGYHLRNF